MATRGMAVPTRAYTKAKPRAARAKGGRKFNFRGQQLVVAKKAGGGGGGG